MTPRRETLTIVVMDVVGSSQLQSDHLKARLNEEIGSLLQSLTAKHRASLSKHKGDGFIVGGHDPVGMAELALETRHYFRTRNWKELGFPDRAQIRVALNTGTIEVLDDGEFSGKQVELACRIEPVVPPDAIWCSASTANFIREDSERIAVSDLGERELAKNSGAAVLAALSWAYEMSPERANETSPPLPQVGIAGRGGDTFKTALAYLKANKLLWVLAAALVVMIALELYQQFAFPGMRTPQHAGGASSPVQPGGISVAVLPFVNFSSDKEQEFFSDGMTEEITSALAKVPNLRVVGRTSAFQFKGENKDLRAIGQSLGATHLLEGSVRKDGNQVRVTAQFIKADDGTHLWTESYDRELKGVFAIQEDIAKAIAGALQVPLGLKQGETLVANRTSDIDSYQDYLRAKALVRGRGVPEPGGPLTEAAKLLEQVVARDPDYAPAWGLLGQTYAQTPVTAAALVNGTTDALRPMATVLLQKAEAAVGQAIRLDPNNIDGNAALGLVLQFRGEYVRAEDLYKQVLAHDPGNPDVLHQYSVMLGIVGRLQDALAIRLRLRAQEPLVPPFNINTALILWLNGRNDEALAILKPLPPTTGSLRNVAQIYASMGRYNEAAEALREIPAGSYLPGAQEEAIRLLQTAPAQAASPQAVLSGTNIGFVYFYAGAPDRIFDFFEGVAKAGVPGIANGSMTLWAPSYAPVRKTDRFKTLMRQVGVVDYWRARGWPSRCHPTAGDDFVCE